MMPTLASILDGLFPLGHQVQRVGQRLSGTAATAAGTVAVLGTTDAVAIGHEIALGLAGDLLQVIAEHPGRPLVFLVDTCGQALQRSAELLCLNGSLAHLARCVDLARRQGHPSIALVTGEAVSGGFLSFGLMADRAYALAGAQLRVMDLHAMARVTRIPHETLVELAASAPTFAPGAENYLRMGAIEALWPEPTASTLEAALADAARVRAAGDQRSTVGRARGGRKLAAEVCGRVAGD